MRVPLAAAILGAAVAFLLGAYWRTTAEPEYVLPTDPYLLRLLEDCE